MTRKPTLPHDTQLDMGAFHHAIVGLTPWLKWFDVRGEGFDRLPEGPALLIGNHGPFGLDAPLFVALAYRETGRAVRGLVDRLWLRLPFAKPFSRVAGCLVADRDNALSALAHGEWVLNYPGGAAEAMRGLHERYTLKWRGRLGFVKVALEAQVPVVPVACIGIDDIYFQLLDRGDVAQTHTGHRLAAWLGARYVPPVIVGPLPGELRYLVGEPIHFAEGPDQADDPEVLRRCQAQVQRALEALIARGLEERAERKQALRERSRAWLSPVLRRARKRLQRRVRLGHAAPRAQLPSAGQVA